MAVNTSCPSLYLPQSNIRVFSESLELVFRDSTVSQQTIIVLDHHNVWRTTSSYKLYFFILCHCICNPRDHWYPYCTNSCVSTVASAGSKIGSVLRVLEVATPAFITVGDHCCSASTYLECSQQKPYICHIHDSRSRSAHTRISQAQADQPRWEQRATWRTRLAVRGKAGHRKESRWQWLGSCRRTFGGLWRQTDLRL